MKPKHAFRTNFIIFLLALLCSGPPIFGDIEKFQASFKIESHYKKSHFKYNLAICAIFRDEASYLKEWIEFHRLLGVEHFYLYNNLSRDHYQKVLAPYIKAKLVSLFDWNYEHEEHGRWCPIQCSAYQTTIKKIRGKVKWLAILDTDEFLFPVNKDTLIEFLKDYEEFGAVCANWQMYGTSHVSKIPKDKLLIETLHLKAPLDYAENFQVKSIIQPLKVKQCASPHFCFFLEGFYQVNADKERFEGSQTPGITLDKIRINHYWSRDKKFFYRIKVKRRETWQESLDRQLGRLKILNSEIDDEAIQRFVPLLKERMKP
jgi:hypothetical protein